MYTTPQTFSRIAGTLFVAAFISATMFIQTAPASQSGGSSGATPTAQSCPNGQVWSKKLKKCVTSQY